MELEKNTILQIIGSLMKKPILLAEVDKYRLSPQDFQSSFEKYIFAAISNLYNNGAERISAIDIDNYLHSHDGIYKIFISNNGIEYLNDAEDLAKIENFNYYYTKLKKYNAIRDLKISGFDTSKIYPENLLDNQNEEKLERFEKLNIDEIFTLVKKDLIKIEDKYSSGASKETITANDKIKDLIKELKNSPEIGLNLQGDIFNTVVRGARKGKFYLRSASSGVGKSRGMVADACFLAYPIRFCAERDRWEYYGSNQKLLYIATEQKPDEIQTMILAYLTGINEEKLLFGTFNENEEKLIEQAIFVMEQFKSNFIITQLPNPSMDQIKTTIRKHCLIDNIEYVFYDYMFSSPALLTELKELKIREDVMLGLLSTMLKDIAVELNVFVMSATQLNGDADKQQGVKNQNALRGAKSIADKVDMGSIVSRISVEEIRTLDSLIKRIGIVPNIVTDIYKLRRGRYTNVRIWSCFDLGTLRKKDLFITDGGYKEIEGFNSYQIMFENNDMKLINEVLEYLNEGIVEEKIEDTLLTEENNIIPLEKIAEDNKKEGIFGGLL